MLFIQWPVFCWDKKPTLLLVFISFLSLSLWLSLSVCFFFLRDWKVYMRDEECLSGCALCCGGWKTSPLIRRKFPAHRGACHLHNMPSLWWKSPSCLLTRRDWALFTPVIIYLYRHIHESLGLVRFVNVYFLCAPMPYLFDKKCIKNSNFVTIITIYDNCMEYILNIF